MAKTINKVELLGRVGSDPEMRYTALGIAVTQLRLATDRGGRTARTPPTGTPSWCGTSWARRSPSTSRRASASTWRAGW